MFEMSNGGDAPLRCFSKPLGSLCRRASEATDPADRRSGSQPARRLLEMMWRGYGGPVLIQAVTRMSNGGDGRPCAASSKPYTRSMQKSLRSSQAIGRRAPDNRIRHRFVNCREAVERLKMGVHAQRTLGREHESLWRDLDSRWALMHVQQIFGA